MSLNVMLDLETMSTKPNAALLSIGAVKFSLEDNKIVETFYRTVDAQDCKRLGLHFCPDTVRWWSRKPKHVLEELRRDNKPLREALSDFSVWYGHKKIPVWANGSDFDNVIIEQAYCAVDLARPWDYHYNRCYRTIAALFPNIPEPERVGDHHNALDDAVHQAKHLLEILGS
jgi:hypothetical protein